MTIKLGVVMDPIGSIVYSRDATLTMLWEAQARGWEIYYFEPKDLFLVDGVPYGDARLLRVFRDENKWFDFQEEESIPLGDLNILLMRKNPPFNEEFIHITYILDHVEKLGVKVVNRPQALRDCNEKLFATEFPQCSPPTLVTQSIEKLYTFWREHQVVVCKPLNIMGGNSIFKIDEKDLNANVIFDLLTHHGSFYIMAQKYIPEIISGGDKRILLVNGEPISHSWARIPKVGDWRGNHVAGAKGKAQPLSDRDRWICSELGPVMRERGLYFVGIDVIGEYLTEINVTSPSCIRELDNALGINITAQLFDSLI